MQQGLLAAAAAYFIWGLFPIYWHYLAGVPALETMAHRVVWCALLVVGYLWARHGGAWLRRLTPRLLYLLSASAVLISLNWWLYIWAVINGHIVETSLGYFINPLVSVLLGVTVLREQLNRAQWLAVAMAGAGVVYLAVSAGHLPWISLALALSFGGYGLLRKIAVVPSIEGLAVESGLLFLPALAWLGWLQVQGRAHFGHDGAGIDALLVAAGLVTATPLVLFAYGARRVPLTTIGLLQYLAPTLQLSCGVLLYGEPFTHVQLLGFSCIWAALAVYAADGIRRALAARRSA